MISQTVNKSLPRYHIVNGGLEGMHKKPRELYLNEFEIARKFVRKYSFLSNGVKLRVHPEGTRAFTVFQGLQVNNVLTSSSA